MKTNLRRIIVLLLAAVMLFALTACGSKPVEPVEGSAPAPEDDTAKNEVIIGFTDVPSNYDPLNGFTSGVQIMYAALLQTDTKMQIQPDLATDYSIDEDALIYTFTLRDDAKFSDGSPITAEDVVFSYETAMENASSLDLSKVESVKAEGNKIIIKLGQPDSTFVLTVTSVGIVPKASYGEDFALNPVTSGPYKLVQYDVDQQFILEANEYYYGGAPGIARAVFVKMADADTRLLAVKSGEVDITLTSAVVASNNTVPGYYLLEEDTVDNFGVALPVPPNTGELNEYDCPVGNNVTCDIAVRKALAYGIDRQQVCDEALNGYAVPAYSENDGMPWNNPESKIDTDVDYAVKLLDEAGWKDTDGDGIREKDDVKASFPLLYFAGDDVRQAAAMSISNQAKEKLGIDILVEGAGEDLAKRMYSEPMILAWGSSNPKTSYRLFHSSFAGKDDWYNPENFRNETVDGYLDQAIAAKNLEEAIPFWQKAQWDGETGTSMRGDCAYVFILNKTHLYWARDGLDVGEQKIHAHGDSWPLVTNLRDWQWK
jgi:peptide/nickel transport system substrate-binding protein